MTKVFKRRVAELAINDMVDLTSCPYLRNQAMAGMVYGVVAHKDVDHPNTVVIGYEGIDHIGYPADTVLTVKPPQIYLFPHELVECDLAKDEIGVRFCDTASGVVIEDWHVESSGRFEVDPAEAYGLNADDLKALEELNCAIDAAADAAINAMAQSIQGHLLITTGDLAGIHFSDTSTHRSIKKAAICYALAEIKAKQAELVTSLKGAEGSQQD
jgi:hypothetical protein